MKQSWGPGNGTEAKIFMFTGTPDQFQARLRRIADAALLLLLVEGRSGPLRPGSIWEGAMLTLYGNLESGNVYKVRLILALTGVAHRRVEVNQVQGDPKSPAFRAMAPIGKVPAVKFDDGRVMAESGALLYWFARGTRYFPDDPWAQAQALQWMFFEQYSHEPAIAVNRYLMHYAPPGDPRRGQLAANAERGNFALSVMERQLTASDWFAPLGYSIADMALYAYTHVASEGGFDLAGYPKIRAWIARVAAQPGHIEMMQETSAEPVQRFVS